MNLPRLLILRFGLSSLILLLGACLYGFAGGGLPRHIRTVAVRPFDNLTASAEIQGEMTEEVREQLQGRLGLRDAPESRANALVIGTIQRYEADVPVGYEAGRTATTARRMVQIVVDIEMVDQVTGRTLWERRGLTGEGYYDERAEPQGRREAIRRIAVALVEGAQSQW